MGCINTRSKLDVTDQNLAIMSFENSLGFNTLDAYIVDRTFHRFSCNKSMSFVQLTKAFSELKLNYSDFESFYSKFLLKNSFNLKKLNTLGVLLSKSKDVDKLKVIFQNYDDDVSGSLSYDELKVMLEDITEIFCEYTPQYSLSLTSWNNELFEYVKTVNSIRKSIVTQLIGLIVDEKKNVSVDDLIRAFYSEEGVGAILYPFKLRSYCLSVRKSILKTVEYAIKALDRQETLADFGIEDEETMARRTSRSRRKSRKVN